MPLILDRKRKASLSSSWMAICRNAFSMHVYQQASRMCVECELES
jgi:hypothetical protein